MYFITLSNIEIIFNNQKLGWRLYIAVEAFVITEWVDLVRKKEFIETTFNFENKTFVVHITSIIIFDKVYPSYKAPIALLKVDETPTTIFPEHLNFANVFFLELTVALPEYTKINNHVINLVNNKQQSYRLIYSLKSMQLETLKVYIETKLVNNFIRPFKSFANTPILFIWKLDNSLAYMSITRVEK